MTFAVGDAGHVAAHNAIGGYAPLVAPTFTGDISVAGGYLRLTHNASQALGPEIHHVGYRGRWVGGGIDVANAPLSRDFVAVAVENTYTVADAVTTNGSPTLTSATEANFTSGWTGAAVTGPGIPNGTTITVVNLTTATMSANATATASSVVVAITRAGVQDLEYWKHRGGLSPTVGFGVTPPDGLYRMQVASQNAEPAMGVLKLLRGASQTGHMLVATDGGGTERLWLDKDFTWKGLNDTYGGSVVIKGDATYLRPLSFVHPTSGQNTGFYFGDNTTLTLKSFTGGADSVQFGTNGSFRHVSTNLGFYAAAVTTKQTVTGSRGANAALASLLTALATYGLITDSSS